MKQIPNLFTLLNLFFGCIAIVCIMQPGISFVMDASSGESLVSLPEKITWASLFIALAALIDFLDGFMARILKVPSDMGRELDSLADGISFGVAPGLIVYQFLRLSFAKETDGLDVSVLWLLPAFIIPCAGAYRLARFNIDPAQGYSFKGVPIPAAGLFIASLPLVYWYTDHVFIINLLLSKWFWYALIIVISYLMVSTWPMLALKFSQLTLRKATPFLVLALVTLLGALSFGWLAVSITFIAYVILSLLLKQTES
jgi:CDP-diacylglycerol--serine O-phosphatidyltransferase